MDFDIENDDETEQSGRDKNTVDDNNIQQHESEAQTLETPIVDDVTQSSQLESHAEVPDGATPSQGGVLTAHAAEFWFPECRNCTCCNGYKHGCKCCKRGDGVTSCQVEGCGNPEVVSAQPEQGDDTAQIVHSSVDNSGLDVIDGDGFDEEDDRNQEEIEREIIGFDEKIEDDDDDDVVDDGNRLIGEIKYEMSAAIGSGNVAELRFLECQNCSCCNGYKFGCDCCKRGDGVTSCQFEGCGNPQFSASKPIPQSQQDEKGNDAMNSRGDEATTCQLEECGNPDSSETSSASVPQPEQSNNFPVEATPSQGAVLSPDAAEFRCGDGAAFCQAEECGNVPEESHAVPQSVESEAVNVVDAILPNESAVQPESNASQTHSSNLSYMPIGATPSQGGVLTAHAAEFWFPECRNCSCCKGYKHGCNCCQRGDGATSCQEEGCGNPDIGGADAMPQPQSTQADDIAQPNQENATEYLIEEGDEDSKNLEEIEREIIGFDDEMEEYEDDVMDDGDLQLISEIEYEMSAAMGCGSVAELRFLECQNCSCCKGYKFGCDCCKRDGATTCQICGNPQFSASKPTAQSQQDDIGKDAMNSDLVLVEYPDGIASQEGDGTKANSASECLPTQSRSLPCLPPGATPSQGGVLTAHAAEFWFPECRNCTCCNGYKHGCKCCKRGDGVTSCQEKGCGNPDLSEIVPSAPPSKQSSYLPAGATPSQGGVLTAHAAEFWFPECRNCSCCNGYKHGCKCCKRGDGVTACQVEECGKMPEVSNAVSQSQQNEANAGGGDVGNKTKSILKNEKTAQSGYASNAPRPHSNNRSYMPIGATPSQGGVLTAHAAEFWFPECRNCTCCNGYKHGCKCCKRGDGVTSCQEEGCGNPEFVADPSATSTRPVTVNPTSYSASYPNPAGRSASEPLVCHHFLRGSCWSGASCRFAHPGITASSSYEVNSNAARCVYFAQGYCAYGESCRFSHT